MTEKIKKETAKELAQEIDVLDHMLTSLVEVLEDKGIMTQEEWEQRIKAKIEKAAQNFRELEK
jgi:hypothetical protein